jgi:flagellar motor switch protein FliN/FliY
MADENLINQDEIERLLNQSKAASPSADPPQAAPTAAGSGPQDQKEIEALLKSAAGKPSEAAASQTTPSSPSAQSTQTAMRQEDIENLLSAAGKGGGAATAQVSADTSPAMSSAFAEDGRVAQGDVDYLLSQAEQALRSIDAPQEGQLPSGVMQFRLEEFPGAPPSNENATLDLIRDVELDLKIELGRTHMYLEDVLRLRKGAVVPLDKLAGDPVDIYVNGRLIARGEVLVLNDNFCVRVAELIAGAIARD